MAYELEIFNGDPDAPEESFAALDSRMAWRVLRELLAQEAFEYDHDEVMWYLPTRTVDIFLGQEDETITTIAAAMVWGNRADPDFLDNPLVPDSSPEVTRQQKADLTRIFIVMQTLAQKLGARVYDPQQGEFLGREDIRQFVEETDHDAVAYTTMDYEGEEPLYPQTTDAEQALTPRKAMTFSPVAVLAVLVCIGLLGMIMTRDGKTIRPPDYVPQMKTLSTYQPASKRNAVPSAEIWVDDYYTVHRSPLKDGQGVRGLYWIIRADGQLLEQRPADDEMEMRLEQMYVGVTYSVQLKLYGEAYGEEGLVVSEPVRFRVKR